MNHSRDAFKRALAISRVSMHQPVALRAGNTQQPDGRRSQGRRLFSFVAGQQTLGCFSKVLHIMFQKQINTLV